MYAIRSYYEMKNILLSISLLLTISTHTFSQNGVLKGIIKDAFTNEPVPFANIVIANTTTGTTSDDLGKFEFTKLQPGFVQLQISSIGQQVGLTPIVIHGAGPQLDEEMAAAGIDKSYNFV